MLARRTWLLVVAAVVAADDAWQHLLHVTGHPDYRSPLWHLFARLLWPFAPVQRLVQWLNEVMA